MGRYDKAKVEPDVIDNREVDMAYVLNANLPRIGFLDVSSGYFGVSGYGLVSRELQKAASDPSFTFRLMVGRDAIRPPTFDTFEEYRRYVETFPEILQSDLGQRDVDARTGDNITKLISLLKQENVQVRRGSATFNHSKCYILGGEGAIVGSSNFTRAGLSGNDELNVGVYTAGTWEKIEEWYQRMWDGATDAKHDMIQVLEQSKFGAPAAPHDIYLKMLFEKYRRMLDAMAEGDTAATAATLAKFQRHAVYSILQTIEERGGAILADSTGLGKTHIGLEVMRKKMAEGKKILLIAPAQVRDTVWNSRLEDAQISARTIGTEELGRKDFDVFKYKKYDFIVIDESQNFRSGTAGRRRNLMKIATLGRKQILLMSATPINNSLMDLYYQASIITRGRVDRFVDIGIPDLYSYMRKAANHKLNEGLEKIHLLLDAIMIRRTRTFIREMYPDEKIDDKPITFPKRDYKPIRYGMTDLFGNVYRDLLDTIKSLHMVPYGIERYNTTLTSEERGRHAVLAHLQVILLLKRFESSVRAITTSIQNKITLFEYFGSILAGGKIASPRELNRIMARRNAQEDDEEDTEDDDKLRDKFFMDEIRKVPLQSTDGYDIEAMKRDIRSDLDQLERYRNSLKDMPKFDKKAEAVAETILADRALETEGRKVLVFTEYTATAEYVRDFLKSKFSDKRVDMITGGVSKPKRRDIIRRFSPVANSGEDDTIPEDGQIDILVSTEVLSEGQNLQDCNYVINYDLPWNPMRIVQRIGRVDRLTSIHDTVHSRECFPDKELDKLLTLVGKLMDKISDINDTVGLDADLLGQNASPRSFTGTTVERLQTLAGDGDVEGVTDELERESDLMPMKTPLNEISQHIRKAGIMKMEEFSMGRRSGKAGEGRKVVLAYIQKSPRRFYSVVYDYTSRRAEVIDDMESIALARCREGEETYLPMDHTGHRESFRQLLDVDRVAREVIALQNSSDHKLARDLRSKPKKNEKIIRRIRDTMDEEIDRGNLLMSEAEDIDTILDSPDLLQWSEDLESLLMEYNNTGDIKPMMYEIKRIASNIGADTSPDDSGAAEDSGQLILVGALFITDGATSADPS